MTTTVQYKPPLNPRKDTIQSIRWVSLVVHRVLYGYCLHEFIVIANLPKINFHQKNDFALQHAFHNEKQIHVTKTHRPKTMS